MKFLVVVLAFVAAATAQYYPGQYNPGQYNRYNQRNPYSRYSTPAPYRPYVTSTLAPPTYTTRAPVYSTPAPLTVVPKVYNQDARAATIVRYDNEIQPDGSYAYAYETDNGIAAQEQGTPRNLGGNPPSVPNVAQGSYSYTSPEGVPVIITYIADEFGFQPTGNVIPTSPPIPPQIARSLEYNAKYSTGSSK